MSRFLKWRRKRDREFSAELQSHLEMHIADNIRAGMTPEEARRHALVALGGVEQTREQFRDALAFTWVGALLQDIHVGWRAMWRSTGFTALVITTLAVGLAATNTAFTLANAVLLRDLPFDDPDRLVSVRLARPQDEGAEMSYPDFRDLQRATRSLAGIAAYSLETMTVGDDDRAPERFVGAYVSANTFSLLGVAPVLGRDFAADDETAGAPAVVLLGDRIWKSRYGADSAVLGRVIRVNARPATVVGVMPEGFEFPLNMPIWQPLTTIPDVAARGRDARFLRTVARLDDGVSVDAATAEMSSIAAVLARDYPETNQRARPGISRFRPGIGAPWYVVFGALMTAVGLLLLVGCANVANLLLARSVQRAREMAIRASLGATRWRIVRQLLVESAVLAVTAGLLAIPLSAAALRLFVTYVAEFGIPFWMDFSMNATVFAFLAVVCLGTAMVFGIAPALHLSRSGGMVNPSSDRTGTAGVWAHRWSGGLVVAEVVFTVVLIAGAASMMRHLVLGTNINQRLDLTGTVTLNLHLPAHTYPTSGERSDFYRRLEERLTATRRAMPVAVASANPFMGSGRHQFSASAGLPVAGEKWPLVEAIGIGERYFETIGIPMRRGRSLADEDAFAGQAAVVVNDALVERFFPGSDAVGRDVTLVIDESPRRFTVVGVVPTSRQRDNGQGGVPIVYVPYLAWPVPVVVLLARSSDARAAANMLREEVRALDPDLPLFDVRTLSQVLRELLWPNRVFGGMFVVFAIIALLVAVVGVYGVVAHTTAQRTKEIGIRMALGASRERLWWAMMRSKIAQVGFGVALGAVAAFVLLGLMGGLLVGRFGQDPLTLAMSAGFLLFVAVLSMLWPVWRATSRSPVVALRYE